MILSNLNNQEGSMMKKILMDFAWNNIKQSNKYFPQKIYDKLISIKNENKQEKFFEFLDFIHEMDSDIFKNLEKDYLKYSLESDKWEVQFLKLLEIDDYTNISTKFEYLEIYHDIIKNTKYKKSENLALIYYNLANIKRLYGLYTDSIKLFKESINIIQSINSPKYLNLSNIYLDLAKSYKSVYNFDTAIDYCKKSIELNVDNHIVISLVEQELGNIYYEMGLFEKSLELLRKSSKVIKFEYTEKHPKSAISDFNLFKVKLKLSEFDEAEDFLKKSLNIMEELVDETHLDLINIYEGFGHFYYAKKEPERALSYYERVLNTKEELLGKKNIFTINSRISIGFCYNYMKELEFAKKCFDDSLQYFEDYDDKIVLSKIYNGLGGYYWYSKDLTEAHEHFNKSIRLRKEILGNNHISISNIYFNLATTAYSENNFLDAKVNYEKCLEIRKLFLNENHIDVIECYHNLANCFWMTNSLSKAKTTYIKVLKLYIEKEKTFSENALTVYENLINLMQSQTKTFFPNKKNIGLELYIQKIKVKNFKLLKDFEMSFSSKVNIIIGENSSGKTSLLQAVTLGLLRSNYQGEVNDYEKYITKNEKKSEIELGFSNYTKLITLEPSARNVTNDVLSPFILSYGSNIFPMYDLGVDKIVESILDESIHVGFTESIFKDYTNEFYNPKSIVNKLEQKEGTKAKVIKEIFINTINEFIDEFKLVKDSKTNKYFFKSDKNRFKLENLSEGYRNNIILITDILIKVLGIGQKPDTIEGIILIDEFDRHLHPKWQSNIIFKLTKVFPKIQFILTTHNPMAVLDREANEITIIENVDGSFESLQKSGTKFVDVGTTLLKYFKVDSLVGNDMRRHINRLTELKLKVKLTKKEIQELENIEDLLDNTVASNFIYNRAYFNFLLFLKENKNINFKDYEKISDEKMRILMEEFKELF